MRSDRIFEDYAKYYDLFYAGKSNDHEAAFVDSLIKKYAPHAQYVLDVGCGTGRHAQSLVQRGYSVVGVDSSAQMIRIAKEKHADLKGLELICGRAQDFKVSRKMDAAVSLFHVLSYQSTDDDLAAYMDNIRRHLKRNGVFICDFWYGPAVLSQRPSTRKVRFNMDGHAVVRKAVPQLRINENCVDVNYEISIHKDTRKSPYILKETHRMRYFFLPELKKLFSDHGFSVLNVFEWLSEKVPSEKSWGVGIVARKD
jgi:SAM-dependent methyltransferase